MVTCDLARRAQNMADSTLCVMQELWLFIRKLQNDCFGKVIHVRPLWKLHDGLF